MLRKALSLLIGLLLPLAVYAQGSTCLPTLDQQPFQDGEKLNYGLIFKWGAVNTEVASAQMNLDAVRLGGEEAYTTSIRVKSAPFFDVFFKMREHFQSWFRRSDLRPLKFIRDTHEGNYNASNLYLYDWDKKQIHADVTYGSTGPLQLDIPLHECVMDIPALVYYLRTVDFSQLRMNHPYVMTFAIDDDVFNIRVTWRGRERIKLRRLGYYVDAVRFSCSVVSGAMFDGGQELQVWFTDDDLRIPVDVMVPLRVGSFRCWIKGAQGLKHPISAAGK